jgi:hypothetical protein
MAPYFEFHRRFSFVDPPFSDFLLLYRIFYRCAERRGHGVRCFGRDRRRSAPFLSLVSLYRVAAALRSMLLALFASIRSVFGFCVVVPNGGCVICDLSGLYEVLTVVWSFGSAFLT